VYNAKIVGALMSQLLLAKFLGSDDYSYSFIAYLQSQKQQPREN